ncbi:hypothetical protein [Roseococcus microcysteis]|uniref:hypothetical protein n=1 Tax=Roseococcus microcysteis TaxID=2771361 RepID=UPI00168B8E7C|nr:hypothetical protein [Roseococcus microcysteis]
MTWSIDARIPVHLLANEDNLALALSRGKPAAVLTVGGEAAPDGAVAITAFKPGEAPHAAACGCCLGRGEAAKALDMLFQGRVRGTVPWFDRVLALDPHGDVAAALREDALTAARYRRA